MITLFKLRSFILHCAISVFLTYFLSELLQVDAFMTWFFALNVVTFFSFGFDKLCAKRGAKRTPEMTYHLLGLVGGFPGIFAGRKLFNHKTSKLGFIIPMWIFFFVQLFLVAYFFGNLDLVIARWQHMESQMDAETPHPSAP